MNWLNVYVVAAFFAALISTFLRGFQNKNVVGGYKKLAFVTGYLMAIADAAIIGIFITAGSSVVLISGLGAGLGYLLSMKAHDVLFKKAEISKKGNKGTKKKAKIESIVQEYLERTQNAS